MALAEASDFRGWKTYPGRKRLASRDVVRATGRSRDGTPADDGRRCESRLDRPAGDAGRRGRAFRPIGCQRALGRRRAGGGEEERSRLLRGEREARREAEGASRAKEEFLAMVSHELHTPLGVITGWAKLLRDGGVDDQMTERALESSLRRLYSLRRSGSCSSASASPCSAGVCVRTRGTAAGLRRHRRTRRSGTRSTA